MDFEQEQQLIAEIKKYVTENLPLSRMEDDELQEKVEEIVAQRIAGVYCPIEQRVEIVEQVYSSIRGFGLLDTIIKDDTIFKRHQFEVRNVTCVGAHRSQHIAFIVLQRSFFFYQCHNILLR